MLSIFIGVVSYYAINLIGVLDNTEAIEGILTGLFIACFVTAYFCRQNKLLFRIASTTCGIVAALIVVNCFSLFIIKGTGVTIIAVLAGVATHIGSRCIIHHKWLRRNRFTCERPAPPLGKEWCRWVIAFLL